MSPLADFVLVKDHSFHLIATRCPYLERVLVQHVQGIPGELGTTARVAVNQVGVLAACTKR